MLGVCTLCCVFVMHGRWECEVKSVVNMLPLPFDIMMVPSI